MPNEQNLIPNNQRTPNEVRENARKGGIESGKTRAKKRDLRLALEMLLEKEWKNSNGNTVTGTDAIAAKLFEQAMKGNIKAFETVRDTVGQKPAERVEQMQTVIDMSKFSTEEIKAMLNDEV